MAINIYSFIFFFLLFLFKEEKKKKKNKIHIHIICALSNLSHNLSTRNKHTNFHISTLYNDKNIFTAFYYLKKTKKTTKASAKNIIKLHHNKKNLHS